MVTALLKRAQRVYNALLFIRQKRRWFYKEYEKAYSSDNGVMIMERCPDLLPDCFSFVRGLVDSQDLSLNISREMPQHDRRPEDWLPAAEKFSPSRFMLEK